MNSVLGVNKVLSLTDVLLQQGLGMSTFNSVCSCIWCNLNQVSAAGIKIYLTVQVHYAYQYDIMSAYDYMSCTALHLAFRLKVNFNPLQHT